MGLFVVNYVSLFFRIDLICEIFSSEIWAWSSEVRVLEMDLASSKQDGDKLLVEE